MPTAVHTRRPIERRTLTSSVYDHLLNEMLSGVLKPGERIVIDRLAQELQVSITPVREALKRLQSEGLVNEDPYAGMRVSALSADELLQLTEVRSVLAGYAAALAVKRVTADEVKKLALGVEALEKAARAGDVARFRKHDLAFHNALYASSGQQAVLEYMEQIRRKIAPYEAVGLVVLDQQYLDTSQAQHRAIMRLLQERKSGPLELLIRKHAMNFATAIARHLRATAPRPAPADRPWKDR